jgi:hypothetical protein
MTAHVRNSIELLRPARSAIVCKQHVTASAPPPFGLQVDDPKILQRRRNSFRCLSKAR